MSKAAQIHQLIHSLSIGEKRKVTTQLGKKTKLAEIYKYFTNKPTFDHEAFLKRFNSHKDLPKSQTDLFNLILDIITHDSQHIKVKLYARIASIQVLITRGLMDSVPSIIKTTKEEALELEMFEEYLILLHYELQYLMNYKKDGIDTDCVAIFEEIDRVVEILENEQDFAKFHYKEIYSKNDTLQRNPKAELERMSALANADLLADISKAKSTRAKSYFYRCKSKIALMLGDHETFLELAEEQLEMYMSDPAYTEGRERLFSAAFNNLILAASSRLDYERLEELFEMLDAQDFEDAASVRSSMIYTISPRLDFLRHKNELKKLESRLQDCEDFLQQNITELSKEQRLLLCSNLVVYNYFIGKKEKAFEYCQAAIGEDLKGDRKEVAVLLKLWYRIFLYEKRDWQGLKMNIEPLRNAIKYRDIGEGTERVLLNFLYSSALDGDHEDDKEELLRKLQKNVNELEAIENEKWMITNLQLKTWIQTQLDSLDPD